MLSWISRSSLAEVPASEQPLPRQAPEDLRQVRVRVTVRVRVRAGAGVGA